jgi:hypothetical protein
VDEFVVDVVQGEFLAGGADVALVVPVAFGEAVVGGDEEVAADVEFALLDAELDKKSYRKGF